MHLWPGHHSELGMLNNLWVRRVLPVPAAVQLISNRRHAQMLSYQQCSSFKYREGFVNSQIHKGQEGGLQSVSNPVSCTVQVKLILFPHYLHLAKIHHPQRTPQTSNSERCPWASMSLSAPPRNQLQLGHCLGPRANWRYCPCSPCSLSLSSAKFRKPH